MIVRLLPMLLLCFLCIPVAAYDFDGKVVGVSDGDTITVLHCGSPIKVRLADIDCPEKKQNFGTVAKQFTSQLVFNKEVHVIDKGKDRYSRTIGEVILPNGISLNRELVKSGYAWQYKKYSKDQQINYLEQQARLNRTGLWAVFCAEAPWDYRRNIKKAK